MKNMIIFISYLYTAWNALWWNYHCGRARLHDDRIKRLDPEWREKL